MAASAHIANGDRHGASQAVADASIARNLGRMCGHIAAAIRTPVAAPAVAAAPAASADPCCGGTVVARRVERCDAPGPSGTTLRRTVVDEIVAPAPGTTPLREHHAS